jgi:hypothetical protein
MGWKHSIAPQLSLLFIILLNKLRNWTWKVSIAGWKGVEGVLKIYAGCLKVVVSFEVEEKSRENKGKQG